MAGIEDLRRLSGFDAAMEKARAILSDRGTDSPGLESTGVAREGFEMDAVLEAVVRSELRPAYYMSRDKIIHDPANDQEIFVSDESFEAKDQLLDLQSALETGAKQVGHVRIFGGFRRFAGTGWLLDEDLLVTNRHVAELFVRQSEFGGSHIPSSIRVELDSLDQIQTSRSDVDRSTATSLLEPIYIAREREPDVAIFKVDRAFVDPIPLAETPIGEDAFVGVVGYPARDVRDNTVALIDTFFGDKFDLKRFSPGQIIGAEDAVLFHDASTLGGSSGSAIFTFEQEPKIAGLHFGGLPNERNAAVPAHVIRSILRDRHERRVHSAATIASVPETPTTDGDRFDGRAGFDAAFLGDGAAVDLTKILAPVEDGLAPLKAGGKELKYHHFSVFMNEKRRTAALTAVNINGHHLAPRPGSFTWAFDGRMDETFQAGDSIYFDNPIDKGHLVRRLDPVWIPEGGSDSLMREIIKDTYHYTVAGPQHHRLNRREWLNLEDYLLDSAGKFDFKISVLTGPVFAESDPLLISQPRADERDEIQVPLQFWKVAVMRDLETGEMRSAGFMLSQGAFLHDMNETAFVLGEGAVFRTPLSVIETATGLDFSDFHAGETAPPVTPTEAVLPDASIYKIRGPEDVFF